MIDHYETLGVPKEASKADITKAYRSKAKKAHPDAGGSAEKFGALAKAHRVLSNDDMRGRYDKGEDVEPKAENAHGEALQVLTQITNMVIAEILQNRGNPETVNLVGLIRNNLAQNLKVIETNREATFKNVTMGEGVARRFGAKKGKTNAMKMLVMNHVKTLREGVEKADVQIATIKAAMLILLDHTFEYDEPAHDKPTQNSPFIVTVTRSF